MRKAISVALVFALAWGPSVAAPVVLPRESLPPEAGRIVERAPSVLSLVRDLRALIDRTRFDPEAVLEATAYDDREIVGFVKQRIGYEPYAGVLRGPEGTLATGAGNSADQALLLARLLKDAGFDARIVRGTLPEGAGKRLQEEIFRPWDEPEGPPIATERAKAVILRHADRLDVPGDEASAMIARLTRESTGFGSYAETEETAKALESVLEPHAGLDPLPVAWPPRPYFWVEYRLAAGDRWTPVHPVLYDEAGPGFDPAPAEYFEDSIPPRFLQTFRLEVHAERRVGDRSESVPIMDPWVRPAANLYGRPIGLQLVPDVLLGAGRLPDPEAIAQWKYAVPLLNGSLPPGGKAVDPRGITAPADMVARSEAGIFEVFSGKASRALEALGSLDAEDRAGAVSLERIVVSYTVATPDRTTTERRVIYEAAPIGESGSPATPLGSESLLLNTGRYPGAYVLDRLLARMERELDVLSQARLVEAGMRLPGAVPEPPVAEHLLLYRLFDERIPANRDFRVYRSSPNLVSIHTKGGMEDGAYRGTKGIDIVFNDRRALREGDAGPLHAPTALLRIGIWDSFAEGLYLESGQDKDAATFSAGLSLSDRTGAGHRLTILSEDNPNLPENTPPGASREIASDLSAGYVVALPVGDDWPADEISWWRLDPRTGSVLAIGSDGRGATLTEDQIMRRFGVSFIGCFVLNLRAFHETAKTADFVTCLALGVAATSEVAWRVGAAMGFWVWAFLSRLLATV